jgi:two-component system copper resistance phosphate regulon response regulator CusR
VLSRDFISERVWDMQLDGSSNVVDVNIRRLRAKIDDPSPRKLIQTVRGQGYVIR